MGDRSAIEWTDAAGRELDWRVWDEYP